MFDARVDDHSSANSGSNAPADANDDMVFLNVYDLIEQNDWLHPAGLGIYHSGVQVYGLEIAYGGHPYDSPGIFATGPRDAPGAVRFRESIPIGRTNMSKSQVRQLILDMGREYPGNIYNLLQLNCNTFAEDLCKRLTGKQSPSWTNRIANLAVSLHCLLPTGWLPPLRPPTVDPMQQNGGDENVSLLAGGQGGVGSGPRGVAVASSSSVVAAAPMYSGPPPKR